MALLVGAAQLLSPVQRCRGWWGGRRGPGRCRAQWGPASSSSWPSGRRRGHTSTHTETNVVFWIHDISVWIRFSAYTFWRYIYIIFQTQKIQKKSQNSTYESRYFLLYLLSDRRIQIRILRLVDPDPGGPKTRGSGGSGSGTLHKCEKIKNSFHSA